MISRVLIFLGAFVLVGCGHLDEQVFITDYPEDLHVELESKPAVFSSSEVAQISARLRNRGSRTLTFYDHDLRSNHSLVVYTKAGERVPTIPPPHPITKRELHRYRRSLAPGETFDFSYSLNTFSPPLPDGTYTARVQRVPFNEVTFRIRRTSD